MTNDSSKVASLLNTVRGLTLKDRQEDYVRRAQGEVRARLRLEIAELENRWQRKEWYRVTIPLVFEFEYEFLLLSVYFDEDADYILDQLAAVFLRHKPLNYPDYYGLLRLLESDGDFHGKVQRFLDILFLERAGLRAMRPKPSSNEYPEINHIVKWIQKQMMDPDGGSSVCFALLHFSKFWQLKYANPFNFQSGILFLAKLEQNIRNLTLDQVKVDFGVALKSVGQTMSGLLPIQLPSPVLNLFDPSTLTTLSNSGYRNRIHDFQQWLSLNALRFQNLSKASFWELFSGYCNSREEVKQVFLREMMTRFGRGEGLPDTEVVKFMQIDQTALSSQDSQVYDEIRRINYLYA